MIIDNSPYRQHLKQVYSAVWASPEKRNLFLFMILLLFSIIVAYFDAVEPATGYMTRVQGVGERFIPRVLMVINLAIMFCYTCQVKFFLPKSPFSFNTALLSFYGFIVLYNIFRFDYYWLSRVSYTLLFYFPFYYAGYKKFLSDKSFYFFGLGLLLVTLYGMYIGFSLRGAVRKEFYEIADNSGYALLSVFIYFTLRPSKSFNVYLLSFIFIAILFSFKRGAAFSAVVGYGAFTLCNLRNLKARKILILPLIVGLLLTVYIFIEYSNQILYRFIHDEGSGAGSGREEMYTRMFEIFKESDAIGIFFGHGFFSVLDVLGSHYAHSDWLELMYDHGLLGMIFYAILMISFVLTRKYISREMMPAFITIISVWVLKSLFSGVYMDRGFSLFFACLGLLLGSIHRERDYAPSVPQNAFDIKFGYHDPRRFYCIPS